MGRLRGQRNRDQDRYWHERRKAEQSGMVGAMDVPLCMFCAHLVAPVDAHFNDFGDAYCRSCGIERGLIEPILIRGGTGLEILTSIDAIGYEEGVTGKSGPSRGHMVGVSSHSDGTKHTGASYRRTRTLEKFQHELERETRLEARQVARAIRESERLQQQQQKARLKRQRLEERQRAGRDRRRQQRERWLVRREKSRQEWRERIFKRALLWLRRDKSIHRSNEVEIAWAIAHTGTIDEGRAAVRDIKARVYRQTFKLRMHQVPRQFTNEQIIQIRQGYASGAVSQYELAKQYKTTQMTISHIVTGSTYRSAGGPFYWPLNGTRMWFKDASAARSPEAIHAVLRNAS